MHSGPDSDDSLKAGSDETPGEALSTESGEPRTTEAANPTATESRDTRIEPPTGEINSSSEPPVSRVAEAAAVGERLFGAGLNFVREAGDDELCLNVEDYATALAQLFSGADEGEFCLAVYGPWGRGKTFLMRRLDLALRALDKEYRTITFSAWKYPSAPEVWVYLYEAFANGANGATSCSCVLSIKSDCSVTTNG